MGRADRPWSYEVENAGVGADGVYALRVWSYYRTPDMPVTTAEKNAVHAVIFKGVPAGNGATAQPPLKTDGVTPSDSLFFENFFQNDYRAYVSSVASGSRQVSLWVLEANQAARSFYESFGWRPSGQRRPEPGTDQFLLMYRRAVL